MSMLHVQAVRASDTPVPQAGILYRALLVAEVHIGKTVTLAVAIGPLEVIEQAPRVVGAHVRSVRNGARQFRQMLPEELGAARVGDAAIFLLVGCVEITTAFLGDLDDGSVVFTSDLHHEVVYPARPYLQAGVG